MTSSRSSTPVHLMSPPPPQSSQTFPPLFVINLAAQQKRRQCICAQLDRLLVLYTMIDAVGAEDISAQELPKIYSSKQARLYVGRTLSLPEIACYLSHLKAMQAIIDSGAAYGVVIEDDVKIQPEFVEVILGIETLPPVWNIIQIGNSVNGDYPLPAVFRHKQIYELPCGYRLSALLPETWGTTGYVIRREFCEYFLHKAYPIFCPIDARLFSIFLSLSFSYSLRRKFLVHHDDETLENSTIHGTREASYCEEVERRKIEDVPLPNVRSRLQSLKSFVFDTLLEYLMRLLVCYYPIPRPAYKRNILLPYKLQLRIKTANYFFVALAKSKVAYHDFIALQYIRYLPRASIKPNIPTAVCD